MKEYLIANNGEPPEDAVIEPAKIICADSLVLADARDPKVILPGTHQIPVDSKRKANIDLFLRIYREEFRVPMDFDEPVTPKPTMFRAVMASVHRIIRRRVAGMYRLWHWNVSYPARMWFHFRYRREQPLPRGSRAVAAMLLDAFAKDDITDADLPYYDERIGARQTPKHRGFFDVIRSRRRIRRS